MRSLTGIILAMVWNGAVLAAVPAYSGGPEDQEILRKTLEEAVTLHQTGDLDGAIERYERVLEAAPDLLEVRSNLGAAYAGIGRFSEAIEQYSLALKSDPAHPGILFNLGVSYYKSAQLERAVEVFDSLLEIEPEHRNALLLKADSLFQLGMNSGVVELLTPREQEFEDELAFAYLLGTALIREKQLVKGQQLIDRILGRGDSAEARLMLGTAHQIAKDEAGAREHFQKAIELNPALPTVHSLYGTSLLATGDSDGAREAFRRELESNPNDFDANFLLGVLFKRDHKFDEALRRLEHALRIRPGAPEVLYQIGTLHLETGENERALAVLEPLVQDAPEFIEAHVSLATVYFRLRRREDGERHRRIAEELNARVQALAPGAREDLGPAYRGEDQNAVPRPPSQP
jgi:tetratricopeptide (TPR) repeat protein